MGNFYFIYLNSHQVIAHSLINRKKREENKVRLFFFSSIEPSFNSSFGAMYINKKKKNNAKVSCGRIDVGTNSSLTLSTNMS